MIGKWLIKISVWGVSICLCAASAVGQTTQGAAPAVPHVDSVVPLAAQPQATAPATIWYDEFTDANWAKYVEKDGSLVATNALGGKGKSLQTYFAKGSQGTGGCKVFFGDCGTGYGIMAKEGQKFDEVYMRAYVKHQRGWTGGFPAKMMRLTSFVTPNWAQAMICHAWGGGGDSVILDPASGVKNNVVVTTQWNDFNNLTWLGVSAKSTTALPKADWWVAVEMRVKLNTPGQSDGLAQLYIDGKKECERTGLNWRGTYNAYGINAVMLESYWNSGAPKDEYRWFDNFIVSSEPIGPVVCPVNPEVIKTPYEGAMGTQKAWEMEIASDAAGKDTVFISKPVTSGDKVTVSNTTGVFKGTLIGKDRLVSGNYYYCRVRQQSSADSWSAWSAWHQKFKVE